MNATMKITPWPSRMGANVKCGRLRLEVWEHGGVTRVVPDDSICGFRGTHYNRVPEAGLLVMAAAAVESWRNDRNSWKECE